MKHSGFLKFGWLLTAGALLALGGCGGGGGGGNQTATMSEITISGQVLYDDGQPIAGAQIAASAIEPRAMAQQKAAYVRRITAATRKGETITPKAQPREVRTATQVTTDEQGNYQLRITTTLPSRVLLEVQHDHSAPAMRLTNARWITVDSGSTSVDAGIVSLPNPSANEITISNGEGQNTDNSFQVRDLPAEVERFFARVYDPGDQGAGSNPADANAFPGEFAESGDIPLNSAGFAWLEGMDANGDPVTQLSQAALVRMKIPASQWADLEDIRAGTDRIELPIYFYDETNDVWSQEAQVGWIEAADGTILPEEASSLILDGSYNGDLYAAYRTGHFSWMNVDYAYIGPWTLSRLDRASRNNDCLYRAMQLSKAIALSDAGRAAYAKVNAPDADLAAELADGKGPELKNADLEGAYGTYSGDAGGKEDQFKINNNLWSGCGDGATQAQKDRTVLLMAATILHETAHWKDDVKKHADSDPGRGGTYDTAGEEGNQLEKDLFGGIITGDQNVIRRDGRTVNDATVSGWLNTANWTTAGAGRSVAKTSTREAQPQIQLSISVAQNVFELGADIPVTVRYENVSGAPVEVMNRVVLEGYPLYFDLTEQASGERVAFLGPEYKLNLGDADFTTLDPGASLEVTVNLTRNDTGDPLYQITRSGDYDVTAVYEPLRGVEQAVSNTITITVGAGGSVVGNVTDAATGTPIAGAQIEVLSGGRLFASAESDAIGDYRIPELPAGDYTLLARAAGYLNFSRDAQVVKNQETRVNFSLSQLLAIGQMRIVLSWGQEPRDLDSHLWLPVETPFHVYYGYRGSLTTCPYAALDVDAMGGFGPETITIVERYPGIYTYAVYKFGGAGELAGSGATVTVFDTTGEIASYTAPAQGTGRWWYLFDLNGSDGSITEINTIVDTSPEPYASTGAGCNP